MTQDDVIRLARETGFFDNEIDDYESLLLSFAKLVAAHEREACAKVCEKDGLLWGQKYAAAIRAKGEQA
jgi:hypothetical protein